MYRGAQTVCCHTHTLFDLFFLALFQIPKFKKHQCTSILCRCMCRNEERVPLPLLQQVRAGTPMPSSLREILIKVSGGTQVECIGNTELGENTTFCCENWVTEWGGVCFRHWKMTWKLSLENYLMYKFAYFYYIGRF